MIDTRVIRLGRYAAHSRIDWINPLCLLALGIVGVFFIYSAQVYTGRTQYLNQIVWLLLGAGVYVTVASFDYKLLLKYSHWIFLAAILLLLLIWSPLGTERGGAKRWLDLRFFLFQPSEAAKIGVLVICASILARSEIGTIKDSLEVLGKLALAVLIPMFLVLSQPDLGSAMVLPPMVFAMLYTSNLSTRFFAAALALFLLLVAIVSLDVFNYHRFLVKNDLQPIVDRGIYERQSWVPLRDYQRDRILSFAAPGSIDPTGISWNLNQSLISVGSGGLTGKGWTQGTQAQLGYLPRGVAHNDFIFSVLAEEKGFLGSMTVIGLFGLVLFNGLRIAASARDRFGTLLALGVTVIFAVHIFVNIAMTIGLIPITGLPLPFLSYGGSFLLSCCVLQGMVQSVYRFRKDF
ncbi:MAG: rod shape-determining protein RodA [Puniceicoccaceae bacterium]|nr:MAG: rod shape-determining protein RodA [Puniceicoccaceae bacterium]